jgi:lysyl-tRNA synthetase class 2
MDHPASAWQPAATLDRLRARARLLAQVRGFFASRGVLEVETPCLAAAATPDPALESFAVPCRDGSQPGGRYLYLQTSPEFAMKRLLAAGSGDIYQVTRAFRDGERGRWHNPEFTLLEWYRVGFDHWRLMDEVADLVAMVLPGTGEFTRVAYRTLFLEALDLDPLACTSEQLAAKARAHGIDTAGRLDHQAWLDLLFTHVLEPRLAGRAVFVHGFPAAQAALARLDPDDPRTAQRFELYVDGIELANGFHELSDPDEQRARFAADRERRRAAGLPPVAADERFLAALEAGMPDCAGVALGLDRLLMLAEQADRIDDVLAFPVERA